MSREVLHHRSDRPVLLAIGLLGVLFVVATVLGLTTSSHTGEGPTAAAHADAHAESSLSMPSVWAITPFVLLLGSIAVFPLVPLVGHWWESNLHRFIVAASLAALTMMYYYFLHKPGGLDKVSSVLNHAMLQEYVPFIVLLFSLYTISGGIRIAGDLAAHPLTNSVFLALGGVLASFIGTTGAAMLLIRPLLETNQERSHVQHTVVFFIFVVCNCGGCLLPIGDPPLFLGYLMGVDFLWTLWNLWRPWFFVNTLLIVGYFLLDTYLYYPRETALAIGRDDRRIRPLSIVGHWPNIALLVGIILSVALLDPNKPFPGTSWYPWLYLREMLQLICVALSLRFGSPAVRTANRFNYHAIVEVAALFVGIFICMQPAIEILDVKGKSLRLDSAAKLFWATGSLSSVLDNAPTYVVFFKTVDAAFEEPLASLVSGTGAASAEANLRLMGVSLGAVFMGAMTYIGNGPNFMVRAIAEQTGVRMPSFFGYVLWYSIPFLIPIFVVVTLIWF